MYRLSVFRLINGFRTVSNEAVLVLAKTITIDILANEMRLKYFRHLECPEFHSDGTKDLLNGEKKLRAELLRDPVNSAITYLVPSLIV